MAVVLCIAAFVSPFAGDAAPNLLLARDIDCCGAKPPPKHGTASAIQRDLTSTAPVSCESPSQDTAPYTHNIEDESNTDFQERRWQGAVSVAVTVCDFHRPMADTSHI